MNQPKCSNPPGVNFLNYALAANYPNVSDSNEFVGNFHAFRCYGLIASSVHQLLSMIYLHYNMFTCYFDYC